MGGLARRAWIGLMLAALAVGTVCAQEVPEVLPDPTPATTLPDEVPASVQPAVAPSGLPPPVFTPPGPPLEVPLDPGKDGWGPYGEPSLPPGFFFRTDVAFVHPVVRNRLFNDTPLNGTGSTLSLPSAELPWTVSPWFDLTYRLPRSLGLVSLNYRFMDATGNGEGPAFDQPAAVRSRLDLQVINIDYGTGPYACCSDQFEFDWRVGTELASVFFDTATTQPGRFDQASNRFAGAGFHARMDLFWRLANLPGLSLYSRTEGAVDFGRISQNFREQLDQGSGPMPGFWNQNSMQTVPMLLVQAGLRYVPPTWPTAQLFLGYTFEHWWYVGQLGESSLDAGIVSNTRGELGAQGIFVRGQIDF